MLQQLSRKLGRQLPRVLFENIPVNWMLPAKRPHYCLYECVGLFQAPKFLFNHADVSQTAAIHICKWSTEVSETK